MNYLYSVLIFIMVGVLDWCIKELPCYPNYRPDSLFWKTIWGGICWGSALLLIIILLGWESLIYCPLIFVEDKTYFLLRSLVYKQPSAKIYYLPLRILGVDSIPMIFIDIWMITWIFILFFLTN